MLNSWWQPVILWRRSHLGQFSVTISPIRILRRRCKKYTELCSGVMFSSCCMSSLHDYMIYSKGLVFCSKKQSQRNKCPGQAMCWIRGGGDSSVSISPAVCPPWREGFLLQWLKMSQACFQSVLEFGITIQKADSVKQTKQSFQILKCTFNLTYERSWV